MATVNRLLLGYSRWPIPQRLIPGASSFGYVLPPGELQVDNLGFDAQPPGFQAYSDRPDHTGGYGADEHDHGSSVFV